MPAYVSTSVFANGTSVESAIETLLDEGIDRIELSSVHEYEDNLLATVAHYDAHFLTHNFFPPVQERLVLNIASADEKIRQDSIAFIKAGIDFAEKIDAKVYTIHPGFCVDPLGESDGKDNYDFRFAAGAESAGSAEQSFCKMLDSLKDIGGHLNGKDVRLAVETQGAVAKKELVFFSGPKEFEKFLAEVKHPQIGFNLNLGHLNLAANAWGFDRVKAVETLKGKIFAVEVTHNEGVDDEHKPLKPGSWYLEILKGEYFKEIPVIFEGRNTSLEAVRSSYKILESLLG